MENNTKEDIGCCGAFCGTCKVKKEKLLSILYSNDRWLLEQYLTSLFKEMSNNNEEILTGKVLIRFDAVGMYKYPALYRDMVNKYMTVKDFKLSYCRI